MNRPRILAMASATTLATAMIVAPALADAPELVKPSANQKAGITTAWQGSGTAIPSECLYVRLARSNKHIAGLTSNAENKPKKCMQYAFDGAALLYGQKKHWFVLTEGSALSNSECKATANLMGPQPWGDVVDFAVLLGCENVD